MGRTAVLRIARNQLRHPRRRLWMPRHTDASHWPLRDGERNRTLAAFARFSYRSTNPREHHISLRSLCLVLGFSRSSAQPLSSMLRAPACDRRQLNSSLCAISLRRRQCFRLLLSASECARSRAECPWLAHSTSVCVCLPRLVCEMLAVRVCAAPGRRHSRFRLVSLLV